MNQLKALNLKKKYGQKSVVENVTIEVNSGEIVTLLGPNGAGKTTSFYMIVGITDVTEGHIFLNDTEITDLPIHKRARLGMGYLPQNSSIFRKMTVEDNLLAIMEICHTEKNQQKPLLEKLLEDFGLDAIRKSYGVSLSGGERRRVEIARTLILSPKFLLLDEPFAGIDPVTVIEIQDLIRKMVRDQNVGVLITDHNVRETLTLSDRSYVLYDGKIIASGNQNEIIQNKKVKEIYLGENFTI